MNINIDDEMLKVASDYDAYLSNPDFSLESVKGYEQARRTLLSMLMAKIETEKMMQRITA